MILLLLLSASLTDTQEAGAANRMHLACPVSDSPQKVACQDLLAAL